MAKAKICDRCGAVYAKNDFCHRIPDVPITGVGIIREDLPRSIRSNNDWFDLCDSCAKKLVEFMGNGKDE